MRLPPSGRCSHVIPVPLAVLWGLREVGSPCSRQGSKSSESEMVTPTLFDDAGPSLGHGYRCLQHDTPDHGYGDTILSTAMTLEVVPLWSLNVNAIRAGGQTTKASASVEQWCHDR